MSEEERQAPPIQIEIGEKESEGVYTNFFLIAHSSSEFIIDCARILPGLPKAKVFARIATTPQHVRLLLSALEENIFGLKISPNLFWTLIGIIGGGLISLLISERVRVRLRKKEEERLKRIEEDASQ